MIPYDTLIYLRQLVADDQKFGDPANAHRARGAATVLDAALADAERVEYFTLRQDTHERWQLGAFDGVAAKVAPYVETARGLSLLEMAVSWPNEPYRVVDFLSPGEDFDNMLHSARVMLSRTRKLICDEYDIGLADLLKFVALAKDADGNVVATYTPPGGAPPIYTSFVIPP